MIMIRKLSSTTLKLNYKINSISNKFLSIIMLDSVILFLSGVPGIVLTSFLLFIDFSEEKIAVLISIASLTQLSQILSTAIYRKFRNKKKVIFTLKFVRSISLLCIPIVPLVFDTSYYFLVILIFIFIRDFSQNLIGGGFVEWNDSYITEERKGIYYGTRNVLHNGVFIVVSFIFGLILDSYKSSYFIYILIFAFALLMTIFQWLVLSKVPYKIPDIKDELPLFKTMFLPLKDKHYRSFITFSILWSLSLSLGRPLLTIYSVKYLTYSYSMIATVASLTAFFKLFSGLYFGKIVDKKSSNHVIIIAGLGFAISNFAYIFMSSSLPVIYILANVFNGIFMIGFNVAKFRLNLHLSKGINMNAYLSMNVFFSGLTAFLSIYLSSFFIKWAKSIDIRVLTYTLNSYQVLFFISGLFHLFALYYFVRTLNKKENINE